jgi:hypothetical protein
MGMRGGLAAGGMGLESGVREGEGAVALVEGGDDEGGGDEGEQLTRQPMAKNPAMTADEPFPCPKQKRNNIFS